MYLCGYAIEIALKARICRTLKWAGFPSSSSEFAFVRCLQTHNLEALILFSGMDTRIKSVLVVEWSIAIAKWSPEQRYNPVGTKTQADAIEMIGVAQALLKVLI